MPTSGPPLARGLILALTSAATFGTSGALASSLLDSGWSAAAAVTARVLVAAAILTLPAVWQLRGRWSSVRAAGPLLAGYGVVAVAGAQVCYFNAVQHLSVAVALLIEYLGILLVVGWLWARHGHRPRRLTVLGAAVAVAGLVLVLDLTGTEDVDLVGVAWGLGAATGLACYFVLSALDDDPLPPLVIAWGGLAVGGATLLVLGVAGVLPFRAPRRDVLLFEQQVSWLLPVLGLSLVAAVVAYVTGIYAARLLGAKLASFVGLTEVVFAVLFAWLLLSEVPTALQAVGGALILGGVVLVRLDSPADQPSAPPGM